MKNCFIVTGDYGVRVVTIGSLAKDLKLQTDPGSVKIKQKDIDSYASDLMAAMNGQSIASAVYNQKILRGAKILQEYTVLTPYMYGQTLKND